MITTEPKTEACVAHGEPQNEQLSIWPTKRDLFLLFLGIVIPIFTGAFTTTWLSVLPLLAMEILLWLFLISKIRKIWCPVPLVLLLVANFVFLALVVLTAGYYIQRSPYIFGDRGLRGIVVDGIPVPSSQFSWATNGRVRAIRDPGGAQMMQITMLLKGNRKYSDAGWGMDLLRFDFPGVRLEYNQQIGSMDSLEFDISGANGGEKVGVSMKSDSEDACPSGACSDEERVPLSKLGVTITKSWQHVSVPLTEFENVDKKRLRNMAFYSSRSLTPQRAEMTFYVRRIAFVAAKHE